MSFSFNQLKSANSLVGSANTVSRSYFYDASLGTYSYRQITSAYDIFADWAAVGDYMLYSITYGTSKFAGFQFDIGTPIASTSHTIVWEYLDTNETWQTLSVTDGTSGFTVSGDVTWTPPDDWGANVTSINGVTGTMWVRARLSAATGITEGGRYGSEVLYYDYTVSHDAGSEYASGSVTGQGNETLTDNTKSWTDGELLGRLVWIHSGTGAGQLRPITWNTATTLYVLEDWETTLSTSDSQYSILNNFEDAYQADVSAGWGVISKCGSQSYSFEANFEMNAAAFGALQTHVEFQKNFAWFEREAATSRYVHAFGFRIPIKYGLDKSVMGNSIMINKNTYNDNRAVGFTADSEYSFSAGNKYTLRYEDRFQSTAGNLRHWFSMRSGYSVNDSYEAWRSVLYSKTSTPRTEARRQEVTMGNSGIEQPFANFDGVRSHYNISLGLFLTTGNTITAPGFDVGQNNGQGSYGKGVIQYYAASGNYYIDDYKGVRLRPMRDSFLSSGNTFNTYWRSTFNTRVTDQKKQLLANARVQCTNALGTEVFNVTTGTLGNLLASTAVSHNNTYSLTSQPSGPTRLRLSVSSFSDTATSDTSNARIELTGTDENDNAIQELIFVEEIGDDDYFTTNSFKTIDTSGILITGWSGNLVVDTLGLIPKQIITGELWNAVSDASLSVTDYNPMTFRVSRPGFDDVIITKDILTTQDWHIPLKRSVLDLT